MIDQKRGLMGQFFFLYLGVTLFGVTIITLSNVYINGFTLQQLSQFNFKSLAVQVVCGVSIFQIVTFIRLRPVHHFFSTREEKAVVREIWQHLIRFPSEIFWSMLIFGIIASTLHHVLGAVILGDSLRDEIPELVEAVLFEQTLSLILAILFYTLIRRLLRPYILSLPSEGMKEFPRSTFLRPFAIAFTSLMLITILSPSLYVLKMSTAGKPVNPWVMFSIAGLALVFGLILFLLLAWQIRDEVQVLIRGMISLLKGDRVWLHRRMPIMSQDEVGQLGVAFNQLQENISKEYEGVQRELQLAYQVQQRLLPPAFHRIGEYQITAVCRPIKEVGGDLYDIVSLTEDRFAVIVGDVSGHGMPSALVMSAILVLFRSDVRRGGSASEVLTRLNRSVAETLQGDMFVTLGLGIFDRRKCLCEYASAGHIAPYILRGGHVMQIPSSSLPLGITKDEIYRQVVIPIQTADRFILFTDGVVEAMDENGDMFGFQRFEHSLSLLDPTASAKEQLDALIRELPRDLGTHDDDQTIMIVECPQAGEIPERLSGAG